MLLFGIGTQTQVKIKSLFHQTTINANCFNVRLTLYLLFRLGYMLFLLEDMKQLYTYLLLAVVTCTTVTAQTFSTRVSANSIGKKDALQVEYIAENLDLQDLILPVFNGWSILSGPTLAATVCKQATL